MARMFDNIPHADVQLYEKKRGLLDLAAQAEKRCVFLKKAVMQQDLAAHNYSLTSLKTQLLSDRHLKKLGKYY